MCLLCDRTLKFRGLNTQFFSFLEIPLLWLLWKGWGERSLADDGGPSSHWVPRGLWCRGPAGVASGQGSWPGVLTPSASCVTPFSPRVCGSPAARWLGHASVALRALSTSAPRICLANSARSQNGDAGRVEHLIPGHAAGKGLSGIQTTLIWARGPCLRPSGRTGLYVDWDLSWACVHHRWISLSAMGFPLRH